MGRQAVQLRQASRLLPFERDESSGLQVNAELIWDHRGWLELSYGVLEIASAGLSELVLPRGLVDGVQIGGQRRDQLWTTTCFEAFLALPAVEEYWEINLAPNGDWAVYHFDRCRQGQSCQALSHDPVVRLERRHHQLRLDARLPISPWWPGTIPPELALTTVLDHGTGGCSHWSVAHPQDRADFHDRSLFLAP